jgi:tetratricopeptide (TPR) repeat protein
MGIVKCILTAALVLSSATWPASHNLVIGKLGNWVICRTAVDSSFSIIQLPNYPLTQSPYPFTQSATITNFFQIPKYSPSPQQPSSNSSSDLDEAESLLQKGQYAAAEERLLAITRKQSSSAQAWFDLGFAESHLGKFTEAAVAYKKAVELNPKWFEANLNLGLTLARSGVSPEAASALRAATQLKPTTGGDHALSNAWFSLAEVVRDSSPQEAIAAFKKAAELNPQNGAAFLGAAKLMQAQGDNAGAEQAYLKAADTGEEEAVQRLIDLYLKQNRLPEAETWLQKYLTAHPQDTAAHVQMARILMAEGKTQEAASALEPLRNSPDPAVRRELASLYMEGKQYDAAAAILQDLLQKNSADAQLHWNLGSAWLHLHKYPEAESELLQALKINPALYDAYWELAYAAQQNKHYELAIRALDVRGKHLPENAASYWIRAVSYDGLRAYKPAAENYKLFLAADQGKSPDDEFKARHRLLAIQPQK